MEQSTKRKKLLSWGGNIVGMAAVAFAIPYFFKPDAVPPKNDLSVWAVEAGIAGVLATLAGAVYYRKRLNSGAIKDGLEGNEAGLWTLLAFAPFGAGFSHYISTGTFEVYTAMCAAAVVLVALFYPIRSGT